MDQFNKNMPDAGPYQIRGSRYGWKLIIYPRDLPNQVYILIKPDPNDPLLYLVLGWLWGHEARREEWWQNGERKEDAWYVPCAQLHPMDTPSSVF